MFDNILASAIPEFNQLGCLSKTCMPLLSVGYDEQFLEACSTLYTSASAVFIRNSASCCYAPFSGDEVSFEQSQLNFLNTEQAFTEQIALFTEEEVENFGYFGWLYR